MLRESVWATRAHFTQERQIPQGADKVGAHPLLAVGDLASNDRQRVLFGEKLPCAGSSRALSRSLVIQSTPLLAVRGWPIRSRGTRSAKPVGPPASPAMADTRSLTNAGRGACQAEGWAKRRPDQFSSGTCTPARSLLRSWTISTTCNSTQS